jgi:hypothetical protein
MYCTISSDERWFIQDRSNLDMVIGKKNKKQEDLLLLFLKIYKVNDNGEVMSTRIMTYGSAILKNEST